MAELLIIKNITREGPGLLEAVLRAENIAFDLVDLDAGQALPASETYKALVILGGPDSANDTTEKMITELTWVRSALEKGIPYLGICLGLQVGVKAAGGAVVPGAVKEFGLFDSDGHPNSIEITASGANDPLLQNLEATPRGIPTSWRDRRNHS